MEAAGPRTRRRTREAQARDGGQEPPHEPSQQPAPAMEMEAAGPRTRRRTREAQARDGGQEPSQQQPAPAMEMKAAGPRTRRRTREARNGGQEPPHESQQHPAPAPAADAPPPEAANPAEEKLPPPDAGGEDGDGDGVDRISALPDVVLGEIICLLPIKDGARTQILSPRWRSLWRTAPLVLDHHHLPVNESAQISLIRRVLAAHQGPARRLRIPLYGILEDHETFVAWLSSPALDGLQELHLESAEYIHVGTPRTPLPLPAAAFRFSATLRVVAITERHILHETVEALHFTQLTHLGLESVLITEDALHSLISGCPVLQCFLLAYSDGFNSVRIRSPSLVSIALGGSTSSEIIIEDAPSLQRLIQVGPIDLHVFVISAPKLETLHIRSGYLCSCELVFDSTIIKGSDVVSFTTVVPSIKTLSISMHTLNLDVIIDFMQCFPCLEKLYIQIQTSNDPEGNNLWHLKHRDLIRSLDIRLKTVVLTNYRGIKSLANFATFFLMNAKRLEAMRFVGWVTGAVHYENSITMQLKLFQLKEKASRRARFHFITRCNHSVPRIEHVQDLSVANPFVCECWNRRALSAPFW